MSLLLTNDSPSINTLGHLPPVPLVIEYSDRTTWWTMAQDNVHFGLQQHGRVRRIVIQAPSLSLWTWLQLMNSIFPGLRDLSLSSTDIGKMELMLPVRLQAPDLRRLALYGVGLPKGLPLLSSTTTLSTLSLTHIGASCYFPPGHLVTRLQDLPHLEELSIGFAVPIPLPSSERELLSPPIPPVMLPSLRWLTFQGVDAYLDNLVAQIITPLLERFGLTFFLNLDFTLVNLTEFIHRTDGFQCLVARVIFNKDGSSIDVGHYEDVGKVGLRVRCEPLDWQIDSAAQVCNALGDVLSTVEELILDLRVDGMPSNWEDTLENTAWHELLLPFIGVKKLKIVSSLTVELSKALGSVDGDLVLELLPALQELEVPLKIDRATDAFSIFMKTRESVGRPIHLLVPPAPEEFRPSPSASPSEEEPQPPLPQLLRLQSLQSQPPPPPERKKKWQARALGLVGRLRGKNQN